MFVHAASFLAASRGLRAISESLRNLKEYFALKIEEEEKVGESNIRLRGQSCQSPLLSKLH